MLPVAVDLDGELEALIAGVLVSRLDGAADADGVRKTYNERPCALGLDLGPVRRGCCRRRESQTRV